MRSHDRLPTPDSARGPDPRRRSVRHFEHDGIPRAVADIEPRIKVVAKPTEALTAGTILYGAACPQT